jgi:glycosyltransferase involved in cell wall biosynthesis
MIAHQQARVAWLTPVLGVGGNLLYWQPLLSALAGACADFRVFTLEFPGDTRSAGFAISCCGKLKRLYANERSSQHAGAGYISGFSVAGPRVFSQLKSYRPDLLVLNEFSLLSLYGIVFAQFRPRTRILLNVECRPRTSGSALLQKIRRAARRLMAKRADAVLTNNSEGLAYLREELDVAPGRIVCKPYLVSDLSSQLDKEIAVRSVDPHSPDTRVHFLYVGQLIQRKGLQHVIEACARMIKQYRGRFVLDVVGDGPYRQEWETLTGGLGLQDHVCFHGRQPYDSLWKFYERAHVSLFPTLSDYRSLTPFEALSLGLPILASIHDGGIGETVTEGENGFAFDPPDTERLAGLMARFMDDPGLIARFSRRSREIAARYTVPRAVQALTEAMDLALRGT